MEKLINDEEDAVLAREGVWADRIENGNTQGDGSKREKKNWIRT